MLRFATFFTFLLLIGSLFSQRADSLIKLLPLQKEDTNKVKILLKICMQNEVEEKEKLPYATEALQLAKKLHYKKGMLKIFIVLGGINQHLGRYEESLRFLNSAMMEVVKSPSEKNEKGQIYGHLGNTYYSMGEYNTSLVNYLKCINIFEELKNKKKLASAYYNIATIYYEHSEYEKADAYNSKAYEYYAEQKDTLKMAMVESQSGGIAYSRDDYPTALLHFKHSLGLAEKLNDKNTVLSNLSGIGSIYYESEKYEVALPYFKKELELARELADPATIAFSLNDVGKTLSVLGKHNEALKALEESADLSKKIGARKNVCNSYELLCEAYAQKGNFKKALEYAKMYKQLKDSLFNAENVAQINGLTAKYENEKKEKEIAQLNANLMKEQNEKQVMKAKDDRKNNIIIFMAASAFLLPLSAFLFFSRQKLKQRALYDSALIESQKKTSSAIIEGQEKERNIIAKELHDSIGTYLSTIKIHLQKIESNLNNTSTALLSNTSELIDRTSAELRIITKNLSSEILEEQGLNNALSEFAVRINTSGLLKINLVVQLSRKLSSVEELNLYRISQELMSNCLKHSLASQASLQLIEHDDCLILMMEDNGHGFDTKKIYEGMGLKNIENRVGFLNGKFKMESVPGKGSTFIIELPIV